MTLFYPIFLILLIIGIGMVLWNKRKIRRKLCENHARYEDERLKVPAIATGFSIMVFLLGIGVVALLITEFIEGMLTNPTETIKAVGWIILSGLFGLSVIWLIGMIGTMLWNTRLGIAIKWLTQRMEVTCDKAVFSDEVKNTLARIDALSNEEKAQFNKGLAALERKWGET